MTTQEQIEYLATKVMGWKKKPFAGGAFWEGSRSEVAETAYNIIKPLWNPLIDENHFRQVLLKVMEDEELASAYLELLGIGDNTHPFTVFYAVSRPDPLCRCQNIISAHQELYGK